MKAHILDFLQLDQLPLKNLTIIHGAIGLVMCASIWFSGIQLAKLAAIEEKNRKYYAYPIGLLFVVTLSFISLVLPKFIVSVGYIAFVLIAILKLQRNLYWLKKNPYSWEILETCLMLISISLGLSIFLGLRFHGPGENISSATYGDTVTYVSFMSSYVVDPLGLPDLLVDGLEISGYANGASSFMGAALLRFGLVDPFLFLSVAVPIIGLVSLAVQFYFHLKKEKNSGLYIVVVFSLILLGSFPYVGYIVESPPALLALPLIFSVYGLASECASKVNLKTIAIGFLIFFCMYLTKITISLLLLVPIVLGINKVAKLFVFFVFIVGLMLGGWFLGKYGWVVEHMSFTPHTLKIIEENGHASLDFLHFVFKSFIVIVLWFFVHKPYRLSLYIGFFGSFFLYSLMPLIFSAAILLCLFGLNLDRLKIPLISFLFLFFSLIYIFCSYVNNEFYILSDYTRIYDRFEIAIVVMSAFLMCSVVYLQRISTYIFTHIAVPRFSLLLVMTFLVTVTFFGFTKVNTYVLSNQLTKDDYDIWQNVRKIVGQDDLVFTNLTGLDLSMHSGWNSYAAVSQRQIYLAGWYNSKLRNNINQLRILLANNDLVLRGELSPFQISLSRDYNNYYAVTSHDFYPVGFLEVYRNDKYSISRYVDK